MRTERLTALYDALCAPAEPVPTDALEPGDIPALIADPFEPEPEDGGAMLTRIGRDCLRNLSILAGEQYGDDDKVLLDRDGVAVSLNDLTARMRASNAHLVSGGKFEPHR